VFGTRSNSFVVSNGEATLIVFKNISFKMTRENMCTSNSHIINEAVNGEFANEGLHGENILHTGAESLILHFCGT